MSEPRPGSARGIIVGACVLALGACASSAASAPAPSSPAIDAPSTSVEAPPPTTPAAPPASSGSRATVPTSATPVAAPAPPAPRLSIDRPYKVGEGAPVAGAGEAELAERRRWNEGGRGPLAREPDALPGHPLPRVIVDVVAVRGPHAARDVERAARAALWGKLIECYRPGAQRDGALRGKVTVVAKASRAGKLVGARLAGATLPDREVARCFAARVVGVDVPPARAASSVTLALQIAPGDAPLPPPASAVVPGPGTLEPEAARAAVLASMSSFEACYAAALADAPALWGRLAVRVHVAADGRVDEAFETESRFPDDGVTACVLRAARALALPAPTGGELRLVLPLRFGAPPGG